jgi:hypothetical protein
MYRRAAFVAAGLALAVGGVLVIWAALRPHADLQRIYGAALGVVGLSVGGVQLLGAMGMPASVGQRTWRGLRPRWPVITDAANAGSRPGNRQCFTPAGRQECPSARGPATRGPPSPSMT